MSRILTALPNAPIAPRPAVGYSAPMPATTPIRPNLRYRVHG
jgi:hypothetical protein